MQSIELYICRIFVVKVDTKQCRRISISPTKSIPNLSLNSEIALTLQGEKALAYTATLFLKRQNNQFSLVSLVIKILPYLIPVVHFAHQCKALSLLHRNCLQIFINLLMYFKTPKISWISYRYGTCTDACRS
jgi:hypothetical protein